MTPELWYPLSYSLYHYTLPLIPKRLPSAWKSRMIQQLVRTLTSLQFWKSKLKTIFLQSSWASLLAKDRWEASHFNSAHTSWPKNFREMVRAPVWEIQLETYNKSSHEPKWGQMPAKFRTCSKCASKFPNQNLEPNHLTCWEHMKLNQCIFEALWCLWYIICLCIVLVHSNVCWYGRNFISSLRKEKGEKLKWTFLCLNLWKKFTP